MEKEFPKHSTISKKYKQNSSDKHQKILSLWFQKPIECEWVGAEWGLPKGRRNKKEKSINVAKREFQEETGIRIRDIKLLSSSQSDMVCENYIANNSHHYNNMYAIAVWSPFNGSDTLDLEEIK
jgi:8-oxo-dGTP pyrophosphatase MutT (NUDIX family)